ncbi:hypothetical protein OF897_13960 [Chryseobacterium formosus]|uniref:Uncharacterized protein n=1 Tax=Chryseobacterium formosus TaxID=1537363 RepID=A0ABT3XSC6_9FLAO|nr:hypothetical protein [Chryseobacterium formosus]MCX8525020.1 hypothetical protein [Chryseobacterium formosus]
MAKGSFNANGQLLQAKTTCSWNDVTIVYSCSETDKNGNPYHDASNMSDWHNCTAETKPSVFTAGFWDCTPEKLDNHISPGSNPGGGGSVGGVEDPETSPHDCTTVATDPSQVGITDPNGCNTVFPTQPYIVKSFTMIVRELPADVKILLNSNVEFYNGLQTYYNANQNLQGENFVKWAAQNVTWTQFQKWFINGYNDAYRTKLSLLSSEEIQEFVNINTEIDASLYDEEFVKETNEALVAFTAYGDIETMTDVQMETVLNQCCPSVIIVPQAMTLEKSRMMLLIINLIENFIQNGVKQNVFGRLLEKRFSYY